LFFLAAPRGGFPDRLVIELHADLASSRATSPLSNPAIFW